MLNSSSSSPLPVIEVSKALSFQAIKVLAGILLLFILPLEYLISDSLNNTEKSGMTSIQHNRNQTTVNFFKALIYVDNHAYLIVVFPVLYHFYDPRKAAKITFVVCFAMYLYSFLAMLYVEPRPFWFSADIKGEICLSGFGNPVLEVMLVTVLFVYTATEIFRNRSLKEQLISYFFCTALITLYFASGIYLGENFPHQSIVTICFSFVYLTIAYTLDKYITLISMKCCFGYNENRKNSVYCFLATNALLLAVVSVKNLITEQKGISIY